ncbi:MAG TPA: aminotransferase class V-fold PLP-dependent enzyme [Gaiellaceae bacterium]|nr:aminotransferase class V-fold PLP-dependent enzyme [Gaiellaceae bacterium]
MRGDFLLDPATAHLNHGSYGACPRTVFVAYQAWQRELERNPVELIARRLEGLLDGVRAELGAYLGAEPSDLALAPNVTTALNAVIRSLRLEPGDEVLTTRHEYGGLLRTWAFVGVRLVEVEPEELAGSIGARTRAVYTSHITSATALRLPVEEACAAAREAGVLSIVDGAHAPGQVPIDLATLGADVYAGNCHKWLCAPRGSGFLWARPEHQGWIEPAVVSWSWVEESTFARRHTWAGSRDPSAYLAIPAALEYAGTVDLDERRALADEVAGLVDLPPVEGMPAPLMRAFELPAGAPEDLQQRLFDEHGVEVVVSEWDGRRLLRVSVGPYVARGDLERLRDALRAELG